MGILTPTRAEIAACRSQIAPAGGLGIAPSWLFASLLAVSAASAQSAANFPLQAPAQAAETNAAPPTSAPNSPADPTTAGPIAAKTPAAPAPAAGDPDLVATPSRHVGADLEAYVTAVSGGFTMKKRATDPFGLTQDPDAKPIVKPTVNRTLAQRAAPEPVVPLSQIVGKIQVTTVVPAQKLFLVGDRSVRQGSRLPLNYEGKPITVEVVEVSSRQISFRNVETGEIGIHKLALLPAGMTSGSPNAGELKVKGMAPASDNAPLVLGSNR